MGTEGSEQAGYDALMRLLGPFEPGACDVVLEAVACPEDPRIVSERLAAEALSVGWWVQWALPGASSGLARIWSHARALVERWTIDGPWGVLRCGCVACMSLRLGGAHNPDTWRWTPFRRQGWAPAVVALPLAWNTHAERVAALMAWARATNASLLLIPAPGRHSLNPLALDPALQCAARAVVVVRPDPGCLGLLTLDVWRAGEPGPARIRIGAEESRVTGGAASPSWNTPSVWDRGGRSE